MRNNLSAILTHPECRFSGMTQFLPEVQRFVEILDQKTAVDVVSGYPSFLEALVYVSNDTLPKLNRSHRQMLKAERLLRPKRWILIWPEIVLFPPLVFYLCRSLYASRANLEDVARDALETLKGFVRGWLLEPLRDVLMTIRSGSDDETGMLVHKEGVLADLEVSFLELNESISRCGGEKIQLVDLFLQSLERMTLSLAKDELGFDHEQLVALSRQIRLGDMTPVMQVYEEDIRTPLRSAIAGTLLRNVFIQVQKTKVTFLINDLGLILSQRFCRLTSIKHSRESIDCSNHRNSLLLLSV